MNDEESDFNALGDATYCPEDNKLRFYSYSRFGNDIKERIKEAGFRWAPKQECWVAAAWTPAREDLLIELCGEIGDEDYSPEERAADRAERFEGYREKRAGEAGDFADKFDDGPQAFGHQNAARAERQARRHDRLRGKAVNQWSKAEYWTERTASVIKHALHKSSAPVRRERILRLEAELRTRCYSERWEQHYRLRLTYENAMLEQEGGKAADIEMIVGGFIRTHQIHKVNKSPVTGRVVSVQVWGMKGKTYAYDRERIPGLVTINIERAGTDIGYRAPTPEELEAFHAARKAEKAEAKKTAPKAPSLINPTEEDAQRLQDIWNKKAAALYAKHCSYGKGYEPTQVRRMTQAEYSERSKGTYSHFETVNVCSDGFRPQTHYGEEVNDAARPVVCKVRQSWGGGSFSHQAHRVIVITDKPQKPLPIDWASMEQVTPQEASKTEAVKKPLKCQFETWANQQRPIFGELTYSHHVKNDETSEEYILFQFSDGTRGSYEAHGVGYGTNAITNQPIMSN